MISNTQTSTPIVALTLILTLLAAPSHSEPLIHVSKSTNCTIAFQTNIQNSSGMAFQNCTRFLCLRNLINGHCSNLQKFQLPQQRCYRECCGANEFDFMKCQNYNQQRLIKEQASDKRLVVALVASLLGVLFAVLVFAVFYLRCCSKEDTMIKGKEVNQCELQWKDVNFTNEKTCMKCKEQGAFVLLSCGIYYHLKCLNDNELWQCEHCSKEIKKVKVLCPVCLKKSIVIRASNFDELDRKTVEVYQYHPFKCIDELNEEMDTERKFSVSTKQ